MYNFPQFLSNIGHNIVGYINWITLINWKGGYDYGKENG